MKGAIEGLQADREALLGICGGLTEAEWKTESGCPGWSVQDVVAHLGALFWVVVDPSMLPDAGDLATERAQDAYVEARRQMSAEDVVADYTTVSSEAIDRLSGLEGQDFEVPLGDLGTYPASVLPNAFAFDHYTHIRTDLFSPRGPLTGDPPAADELRLVPAIDWIEAALPQQNTDLLASLGGRVDLVLEGPGGGAIHLGSGPRSAEIHSGSAAFVRWITQRSTWEGEGVETSGDKGVLDVARELKVF
ncbi:MAG TPA: maleylpyruvate isomerase family mycothiol-dependent enzyme [Acidimicrobiales bacterium]|nr:maleylpyruvate isomerase family mycothiol-dependent enzyme [Acidimicrobiales bacterium]